MILRLGLAANKHTSIANKHTSIAIASVMWDEGLP